MRRLSLLPLVSLTACFGSLSPDRTPSDVGLPTLPPPPPPLAPLPPPSPGVASFTVSVPSSVRVGSHVQLHVTLHDSTGAVVKAPYTPLFYSQNPSVASVSATGLLSGLRPGVVNVIVVVTGVSYSRTRTIEVVE